MKSIRTKLKLNNQQKTLMAQHAGYSRWCYNWGLSLWNAAYIHGYKPNARKLREVFTNHTKPLYPWMKNLSSRVYQYAFINLGEAFKRFFQGLGKHPRFKKKGKHDSFTIDNCGKPIELNGWNHKLPFIGIVKTYEPVEATTKKITISRQAGDWYLSCSYEFTPNPTEKTTEVVGVDLGVKTLATLSTGVVFPGAKSYKKFESKLSKLQYLNRNKKIGSANWKKAQLKIAKLHTKVANIRKDVLHKLTTYLAKNHSIVSIEDLNVRGMLANHKLAKSIADQGFYEFRRQLEYKCEWYGSELVVVDRFFPSSKTCSNCGHVQDMPLNVRTYDCPECGLSIDRDLNASINLRDAVGLTVNACG
ncbi:MULTISPECIES: RNA-guided endonuclease TnpB family protein [Okeania]|uniref:Transposase n=1 Tax=Okeania hirsuta TaxID=1458930 RepID=A0A3N6PGU8_9CYAN|nr:MULTISPECIES: RNA-guided endonuclease TnpB family protein [Okeania]NET15666.1 IS200/IS605 family element transposase accessory protein TnpB [Okeania sp. SIO1H6]NEP71180.1 IS200/IS605 family element transposase accessory protein TnpB [Okeania sp. SIO2G5]NEP92094.1 IS200/IS605 family element transposase accessory protein TnpB [Okeania sp. SIO2F5]NEQ90849.1 IS200/IS605 family element transposase accessory protein TnpB [Okeania sp. SIO2G4]NES75267.1 IS200/IS605 family element transposase access